MTRGKTDVNNSPKTEREARLRLCHYFRAAERGAIEEFRAADTAALKSVNDIRRFGDAWHGGFNGADAAKRRRRQGERLLGTSGTTLPAATPPAEAKCQYSSGVRMVVTSRLDSVMIQKGLPWDDL